MKRWVLTAATAAFTAVAVPSAWAAKLPAQLKPGECMSKADMLAGLDQEGQFILITGEVAKSKATDGSRVMAKEAFTADRTLNSGYQIGNNASGDYCKTANLFDIRLFDSRGAGPDAGAFTDGGDSSPDGSLNGALRAVFKNARELPVMQFHVRANDSVGEILVGTVTMQNPPGSGGLIISTMAGRLARDFGIGMYNVRLSPTGEASLPRHR